ncbi:Ig-like domain-containing protein [Ferrimonas sp. SCSIO 43195]|uniref:Ig-like domain-containing protein n=1 Tax=Ferrimonas sp. SCSIO 43195 TaxID=2822844 RepID=UPI0020753B69|nr:Ig-like domain-containing protein [Ferrimonas sp. SCSIO 43195]USD37531.1 cadherin-like domain-containing protein [Ferrimonas sp. SCSIO 43195]
MKTHTRLLATLIAASLMTACSDDDDNTVVVPDPNTPPVAADLSAETTASEAISIDVLAQATDADGDTLTLSSAVADQGVASISDGLVHYDPDGFVGSATIDYTISDGSDDASAKVRVTVTEDGQVSLSYVGSEACGSCHAQEFATHQLTGHNFKISEIDGEMPEFPYTNMTGALEMVGNDGNGSNNTLGIPESYDDVTYTSGGYGWKYRWFDKDGYVVTGSAVQYNIHAENLGLNDQVMGAYKGDKFDYAYGCGNCHNTGWKPFTGTEEGSLNPHKQDDLPGIMGTYAYAGVQCEACHGAGSEHIKAPSADNIVKTATPRTSEQLRADDQGYGLPVHCSECHTRDGNRTHSNDYTNPYKTAFPEGEEFGGRIAVSGGLPKHHQGHDELMGIDPDNGEVMGAHYKLGMSCNSCHNPHKSTLNQDQPEHAGAVTKVCSDCHGDKPMETGGMLSLHNNMECTTCHMPDAVKNATYVEKNGVKFGDEMIHLFKIDLYDDRGQFTEDGHFMYPYLQEGFACGQCHEVGEKLDRLTELGGKMHQ